MITLDTPIEDLSRVGKTTAARLKKLNLYTVRDLIFYLPFRYDDLSVITSINNLPVESMSTVRGIIELIENRKSRRKRQFLTEAIVSDDSGSIKVIWFNQRFLTKTFQPGDEVYLSGCLKREYSESQFVNPVIEKVKKDPLHTARIVPLYPLTEGITQKQLRFLMKQSLSVLPQVVDWLPRTVQLARSIPPLHWTLRQIHFPDNYENVKKAVRRLKFSELFLLQVKVVFSKKEFSESKAPAIPFHKELTNSFVHSLPFELTTDQKKIAWQVLKDVSYPHPAHRLIEGEVGSGKTVVIAIVFLNASATGCQSVLMVPTEILAQQHYVTMRTFFKNYKARIALFTRTESRLDGQKISKSTLLKKIAQGDADIIIGTHALIVGKTIPFKNLSIVCVDEQHRFGVKQRKALSEQSGQHKMSPHFISMTATPIPRTLSLVLYGDLKISRLLEMPKERKKILTEITLPQRQLAVYEFIRRQIQQGFQAFIICPLIDPSDILGVKSVTEEYERLRKWVFQDLTIDYLHGKLKPLEKEARMKAFAQGRSDILVTTSVVEVGVDVPNATVMVIEGAERFGLAQLHQFRGRVGRGKNQSYCFLFTNSESRASKKRLKAFVKAKNCFELAELDLELRGPGEMFGSAQSGSPDLKVASFQDWKLAIEAKEEVEKLISDKDMKKKYPALAAKIKSELLLATFE